jgi:hypothetical protein
MMRAENASKSSTTRWSLDRQSSRQRSRITNARSLLPDLDGRSRLARHFRDIQNSTVADQGGPEHEEIDVSQHALLCSSLVRIANKIGINRIAKDITSASLTRLASTGFAKDITPSLFHILREHGHEGAVCRLIGC